MSSRHSDTVLRPFDKTKGRAGRGLERQKEKYSLELVKEISIKKSFVLLSPKSNPHQSATVPPICDAEDIVLFESPPLVLKEF